MRKIQKKAQKKTRDPKHYSAALSALDVDYFLKENIHRDHSGPRSVAVTWP